MFHGFNTCYSNQIHNLVKADSKYIYYYQCLDKFKLKPVFTTIRRLIEKMMKIDTYELTDLRRNLPFVHIEESRVQSNYGKGMNNWTVSNISPADVIQPANLQSHDKIKIEQPYLSKFKEVPNAQYQE